MWTLFDTLKDDLKTAMKARDVVKRDMLRFIVAQIKNVKIDKMTDLSNDDMIKIMQKEIKQIQETMVTLTDPSRSEELAAEQNKIEMLSVYLPTMLTAEELKTIVLAQMESAGVTEPAKERGKIIWPIMAKYGATVDGRLLNEVIMSV